MKAWKEITRILLLVAGCVILYLLLQQSNFLSSEGYAPAASLGLRDVDLRSPTAQESAAVQAALQNLPPAAASPSSGVQPMDSFPATSAAAQFEAAIAAPPAAAGDMKISGVDVQPAATQPGFCSDPAQCWPQQQLTAEDLLPKDKMAAQWAELHPEGQGSLKDRNFVEAGYLIGMSSGVTKNANYGLRKEPPVPRFNVGPWGNSTIEPSDMMRKPLDDDFYSS